MKVRRKVSRKARTTSSQRRALHRLERLYAISKHLATFENVEQGFPKMLSLAAETFPLLSAVLIEKRGEVPKTTIWPRTGFEEAHIKKAITHARTAYSYLAGSTPSQSADLSKSAVTHARPRGGGVVERAQGVSRDKFLVLPIVLEGGSIFGVLQLEALGSLDEGDLAFVDALTSLIAVVLDRHYLIRDERALQKTETEHRMSELQQSRTEAMTGLVTLVKSQKRVNDLEEEQSLREKFVSTLSHDLRTPLTAAKMSAQLISLRPGNAENCKLLAGKIVNDIGRVDHMIGDLLDANRIRAGEQLRLDVNICDLRATVTDTMEMLRSIHGDRLVLVVEQQEVWGYWSHDGMRRVIENLVNNAVKYGRPHRPVTIRLTQSNQSVRITVHNEGDPIPPQDQAGLFKQFRRTDSAQASQKKGWGLGLALVHGIVEAHGGKISIESSAGHGTTFSVELPNDSRPFQAATIESVSA